MEYIKDNIAICDVKYLLYNSSQTNNKKNTINVEKLKELKRNKHKDIVIFNYHSSEYASMILANKIKDAIEEYNKYFKFNIRYEFVACKTFKLRTSITTYKMEEFKHNLELDGNTNICLYKYIKRKRDIKPKNKSKALIDENVNNTRLKKSIISLNIIPTIKR